MSTRKPTTRPRAQRPTVAMLLAQEARADRAQADADAWAAQLEQVRREADALRARADALAAAAEPEADALAGCTKAIEAMYAAERAAARNVNAAWPNYCGGPGPSAHRSAVGRILLHLAARYGVPLVPEPPPTPPESVLVQAPSHLAGPLRELLGHE